MAQTFRIEGLKELDEALTELPKSVANTVLLATLKKEGKPIAQTAARLAPDDPETNGKDLKSSILIRAVPKRERQFHVEVAIGPSRKTFYGMFMEWGTAHISPRPFMRPAFDQHVQEVLGNIRNRLADEIERARKRLARKAAAKAKS